MHVTRSDKDVMIYPQKFFQVTDSAARLDRVAEAGRNLQVV